MAEDVKDVLSKMKVKELRAFAKHHRIKIKGLRTKKDIVEKISSHKRIEEFLEEEGAREEEPIEEEE